MQIIAHHSPEHASILVFLLAAWISFSEPARQATSLLLALLTSIDRRIEFDECYRRVAWRQSFAWLSRRPSGSEAALWRRDGLQQKPLDVPGAPAAGQKAGWHAAQDARLHVSLLTDAFCPQSDSGSAGWVI